MGVRNELAIAPMNGKEAIIIKVMMAQPVASIKIKGCA